MTLYQFNMLDEAEQMEAIWKHAVTLAFREDEINKYELLQIDDFYIELEHHKEYNVLRGLRTFKTTTLLEPYLGQIEIPKAGE